MKALIAALLTTLLGTSAHAAYVNRYNVDITLTATVNDVEVNGYVFAGDSAEGAPEIKRFGYADLDRYAWNPGDSLTIRWRLRPFGDLGTCVEAMNGRVQFGGFLGAPLPWGDCEAVPAVAAQLRRVTGERITDIQLGDSSDGVPFEYGPIFNLNTGEVDDLTYASPDAHLIVPDCCDILYDPETDKMISRSGTGTWTDHYYGFRPAGIEVNLAENGGSGIYHNSSFPDRAQGYEIWAHGWVDFATNWSVRIQAVPEPSPLALVGLGLLAIGARRRDRR